MNVLLLQTAVMGSGSFVIRRSLGRRLKTLREASGKTWQDVDTARIAGRTKLHRIENTGGFLRVPDVQALCLLYGVAEAEREQLVEMARSANSGPAWWEDYHDALPSWFVMYVELESAASELFTWQPDIVPGLLQTPEYQYAVAIADPSVETESDAQRQVRLRTERQRAVLERSDPLRLTAIVGAGALQREVGGPEVIARQRDHLLKMSTRDHVTVRVLPWSAGAHAGMKGAFGILGFEGPQDPDVIYLETDAGARYIEQTVSVKRFRVMFGELRRRSIPIEEF